MRKTQRKLMKNIEHSNLLARLSWGTKKEIFIIRQHEPIHVGSLRDLIILFEFITYFFSMIRSIIEPNLVLSCLENKFRTANHTVAIMWLMVIRNILRKSKIVIDFKWQARFEDQSRVTNDYNWCDWPKFTWNLVDEETSPDAERRQFIFWKSGSFTFGAHRWNISTKQEHW